MIDLEKFECLTTMSDPHKCQNIFNSVGELEKNNIEYVVKNEGHHLVIKHKGHKVNFWPSSQLFNTHNGKRAYGIKNLINYLDKLIQKEEKQNNQENIIYIKGQKYLLVPIK